eukprot:s50_g35.t2
MQRYSPLLSRDTPPMCKVRRRGGFLFDRTTSKACWDLFPRLIDYISKMALLRENERRSDIFGRAAPSVLAAWNFRIFSTNLVSGLRICCFPLPHNFHEYHELPAYHVGFAMSSCSAKRTRANFAPRQSGP